MERRQLPVKSRALRVQGTKKKKRTKELFHRTEFLPSVIPEAFGERWVVYPKCFLDFSSRCPLN